MKGIDRYWLLTWTMYGQWLPGDPRGSVTRTEQDGLSHRVEQDEFGTPVCDAMSGLYESSQQRLRSDPIFLTQAQAESCLSQFQETADFRKWVLVAVAIMANHVHVVLGVPGDPDPEDLLRDLKAYGSRKLNKTDGKPASETLWTQSGSKRKLWDRIAIRNSVEYVRDQEFPLVIWINPISDQW